jgi:hypothetical protein
MTVLLQSLIDATRTVSGLKNNQSWLDSDIAIAISDAGSEFYDKFTATNQHYNITPFDFTLAGGVGGNSVPLPDNFQQGHGLELNPTSARPITVPYLSNWLDRNNLTVTVTGPQSAGREYAFSDGNLVVFPPSNSAGNYRLYFTPMWAPLALTSSIDVETASVTIPVVSGHTGITAGLTFMANDLTPANIFLPTDLGDFLEITGATNPGNNGFWTIGGPGVISANQVGFGVTTGLVSETFPDNATVTLFRQSNVTAAGTWTFFGANQFTQTTGAVNVGDTINVSGAANAGNNGSFVVTAVGLNTVVTADTGLVAENFATDTVTVTVQPGGTRNTLPAQMTSWAEYLKVAASITIRDDREQPVASFQARLQRIEQRVMSILSSRKEEPSQPPLTRGHSTWLDGFDL